jgi:hypothetical protein
LDTCLPIGRKSAVGGQYRFTSAYGGKKKIGYEFSIHILLKQKRTFKFPTALSFSISKTLGKSWRISMFRRTAPRPPKTKT